MSYPEYQDKATLAQTRRPSLALPAAEPSAMSARSATIISGDESKSDIARVERQPRRRFAYLDVDRDDAGQREALGIRPKLDGIVDRNDRLRKPARRGVE